MVSIAISRRNMRGLATKILPMTESSLGRVNNPAVVVMRANASRGAGRSKASAASVELQGLMYQEQQLRQRLVNAFAYGDAPKAKSVAKKQKQPKQQKVQSTTIDNLGGSFFKDSDGYTRHVSVRGDVAAGTGTAAPAVTKVTPRASTGAGARYASTAATTASPTAAKSGASSIASRDTVAATTAAGSGVASRSGVRQGVRAFSTQATAAVQASSPAPMVKLAQFAKRRAAPVTSSSSTSSAFWTKTQAALVAKQQQQQASAASVAYSLRGMAGAKSTPTSTNTASRPIGAAIRLFSTKPGAKPPQAAGSAQPLERKGAGSKTRADVEHAEFVGTPSAAMQQQIQRLIAKLKKLEPHHQLVPIPLLPGQVNKLQPALRSVFPERAAYVEFDSERGLAIHRRNLPATEIELSRQARARLGLLLDWHISGVQHLELRQVPNNYAAAVLPNPFRFAIDARGDIDAPAVRTQKLFPWLGAPGITAAGYSADSRNPYPGHYDALNSSQHQQQRAKGYTTTTSSDQAQASSPVEQARLNRARYTYGSGTGIVGVKADPLARYAYPRDLQDGIMRRFRVTVPVIPQPGSWSTGSRPQSLVYEYTSINNGSQTQHRLTSGGDESSSRRVSSSGPASDAALAGAFGHVQLY